MIATFVGFVLGFIATIGVAIVIMGITHADKESVGRSMADGSFVEVEAILMVVLCVAVGLCQWIVIRPLVPSARLWIGATVAGGLVSGGANIASNILTHLLLGGPSHVLAGVVVGLTYGAMTGATLVYAILAQEDHARSRPRGGRRYKRREKVPDAR
jgi:hypothetical protein